MKKFMFALSLCAVTSITFSSCDKAGCYTCSQTLLEVSVCDDNVTGVGITNQAAATSIKAASSGSTTEDYKTAAESIGYSCN